MRLYLNDTSPFARLVRATASELGLERLERLRVDPWADPDKLLRVSSLGRVPVLVTDSGQALTETLLILPHLIESAPQGVRLHADDPGVRAELGIAYGMMELAFSHTIQAKHGSDPGSVLQSRRRAALHRSLSQLDTAMTEVAWWTLSRLCLWITLDYIRFRAVVQAPADRYPALNRFLAQHQGRESLASTTFG